MYKFLHKIAIIFFIVFCFCSQVNAAGVNEVKQAIIKQSSAMGVEPAIMLSIAKTESGFRQEAKGASGNIGVFQLLPATAKRMGLDAYKLEDNIKGGILYYKKMYEMFGSMELAVAAYNAGPDAVKRNKAVPSYSRPFVSKIMADYKYYKNNL